MFLAYLDESYSQRALTVAGVVVDETRLATLTASLTNTVAAASRRFPGISLDAEFHAYELTLGRGDWAALQGMTRARATIYRDALEVVAGSAERVLVERVVPGPPRGNDSARGVHVAAVARMLKRIEMMSQEAGTHSLVFADDVSYRDELVNAFEGTERSWVLDTLHFASSRASRAIQAADLCAYVARRQAAMSASRSRASIDAWLWGALEHKVDLVDEVAGDS